MWLVRNGRAPAWADSRVWAFRCSFFSPRKMHSGTGGQPVRSRTSNLVFRSYAFIFVWFGLYVFWFILYSFWCVLYSCWYVLYACLCVFLLLLILDFGTLFFVCHKTRRRVRFRFRHLARHPVLPSTPKDAHRKVNIDAANFSQSYDTRAKLCPKPFENLLISWNSGMLHL